MSALLPNTGRVDKTRVLHIATMLGSGGLEKWLVDLITYLEPRGVENYVLVQSGFESVHGKRAREQGIPVIIVANGRNPLKFSRALWRLLHSRPRFDAIHSHVHYFSGLVLLIAAMSGIRVRVAHAHNDTANWRRSAGRTLYAMISRWLIRTFATNGFGNSGPSARDLFGGSWDRDPRWNVMPCGIEPGAFGKACDAMRLRADLGIEPDAFVLLQVGRFVEMKNQEFSIRVLAALKRPKSVLVLVGEGGRENDYRSEARALNVEDRVVFAGGRLDVPQLLDGIANVLLMPSRPGEGPPIAVTEAQAAGVHTLISTCVPELAVIIPSLVRILPLDRGPAAWAGVVDKLVPPTAATRAKALSTIAQSQFTIESNANILSAIYGNGVRV